MPRPRSWTLFLATGIWLPERKRSGAHAKPGPAPRPAWPTPPAPARTSPADKVELELAALRRGLSLTTGKPVQGPPPIPVRPGPPPAPARPSPEEKVAIELAALRRGLSLTTGEPVAPPAAPSGPPAAPAVRPRPKDAGAGQRPSRGRAKPADATPTPQGWRELAAWWDAAEED